MRDFLRKIRSFLQRLRPPRRLRTTLLGKILIGLSIVIGVAAINTGNNLLYLVLGILFGIIAASGFLSEEMVRDLELSLSAPPVVFAGRTFSVRATIMSKKKVTTHLIEVALWMKEENPKRRSFFQRFFPIQANGKKEIGFALLPFLPPRGKADLFIPVSPLPRRGSFSIIEVEIRTRFPFQFYEKILPIPLSIPLLAAPAPRPPLSLPPLLRRSSWERGGGSALQSSSLVIEEFSGLRESSPSDPISRIHWKRAVHPFPPMVKVYSGGAEALLHLHLGQGEDLDHFERGLEEAMGICEILWRNETPFVVNAGSKRIPGHTPRGKEAIMQLFARITREELPPGPVYQFL